MMEQHPSIDAYKTGLGRFRDRMPGVGEAYMQFTAACFASGALPERTKHLIALGIALGQQDEICVRYHTDAALQTGASEQDVLEAVAVAAAFGGGAAMSLGVTLAQQVLEARTPRH